MRVLTAAPGGEAESATRGYVGILKSSNQAGVVVDTGTSQPVLLPLNTVRQIDVSRGRSDRRVLGAILGGAISGTAFVAAACAFSDGSCDVGNHVGGFIAYYAVGAIPGIFVGRSIGSRHHGAERWEVGWTPASGR